MKRARFFLLTAALWMAVTLQALSYTVILNPGLNTFANHLSSVFSFATVPLSGPVALYTFNGLGFNQYIFDIESGGWSPGVPTLAHGQGAIIDNLTGGPLTITVTGTAGTVGPTAFGPGLHLVGSQQTGFGTFETIVGGPPGGCPGIELLRFSPYVTGGPPGPNAGYVTYTYATTGWSPTTPIINEGEAVFLHVIGSCAGSGSLNYSVSGISPSVGSADCQTTTLQVAGVGFLQGATVKLTMGATDIVGANPTVLSGGFVLSADFNLNGATAGAWDVEVSNSSYPVQTLPGAFTIAPLTVTAVSPATGNKCSTTTLAISGGGFCPNATVKLVNASAAAITASSVSLSSVGTELYATFNIPDTSSGSWDVEVSGQTGSPVTLAAGFTILSQSFYSVTPNLGKACGTIQLTALGSSICPNTQMKLTRLGQDILGTAVAVSPGGMQIIGTFNLSGAAAGIWDAVLTGPGGSTTTLPGAFTVGPTVLNNSSPVSAGDCAPLTLQVQGSGICPNSTLQITRSGQTIVGTLAAVNAFQTAIQATFNVAGAQTGAWDVEVVDPNGVIDTLPGAFTVAPLALSSIFPTQAGNCDTVQLSANGTGLPPGASMTLVHSSGTQITASSVSVNQARTVCAGQFTVAGAAPGAWDLVVACPNGSSVTLPGAFTVTTSLANVSLVQPNDGKECQTVAVTIRGGCFASGSSVSLKNGAATILAAATTVISPSEISAMLNLSGAASGLWDIEVVSPGTGTATMIGAFTVFPCTGCDIDLEMQGPPIVGINRVRTYAIHYKNLSASVTYPNVALSLTGIPFDANIVLATTTPVGIITGSGTSPRTISFTVPSLAPGQDGYFYFSLDIPSVRPPMNLHASVSAPCQNDDILQTEIRASYDPNDKIGLSGAGPKHYITGTETLPHTIHFENKASATAPAQEVFVYDYLDPVRLDLATFSLGPITFGSHTVTPPAGQTSFTGYELYDVDGNPATSDEIVVHIHAALITSPNDPNYGRLIWSLQSLDLSTGRLPVNPLLGFLPPNVNGPEGEGTVSYSVKPQPGLSSGQVFGTGARIVFDLNESMWTPIWINSIDSIAPSSQVQALPATQSATAITVNWSGTDADSGIASYDLYVSDESGPYVKWLSNATGTSATFNGQLNHSYRFYSVAKDQVGHVEAAPSEADAFTKVEIMSPTLRIAPAGNSVVLTWDDPSFHLETSTSVLPSAVWTPVTGVSPVSVTKSQSQEPQFFRLARP